MKKDRFSELRKDLHHGGWVLCFDDPKREQLLAIPREQWKTDQNNLLKDPESHGAHIVLNSNEELPDGKSCRVRVIANRYPLYRVEAPEEKEGRGIYDIMQGLGAHEIVIESEEPTDTLLAMHPQHYALVLKAYQARITDLRRDKRLRSFSIFREWCCGEKEQNLHPLSQLIASAIIPLGLKNELDAAREHFEYKERCIFCDMIRQELHDEERLVHVNDRFVTFCPFASRYPFEVHLFPRAHTADFCNEPSSLYPDLASMIRDTAYRLEQAIPSWRVLMVLHSIPTAPSRMNRYDNLSLEYHWHIEFLPQPPGYLDWFARTGTYVEGTLPEKAADYLRQIEVTNK